jgi:hypothetical protein
MSALYAKSSSMSAWSRSSTLPVLRRIGARNNFTYASKSQVRASVAARRRLYSGQELTRRQEVAAELEATGNTD